MNGSIAGNDLQGLADGEERVTSRWHSDWFHLAYLCAQIPKWISYLLWTAGLVSLSAHKPAMPAPWISSFRLAHAVPFGGTSPVEALVEIVLLAAFPRRIDTDNIACMACIACTTDRWRVRESIRYHRQACESQLCFRFVSVVIVLRNATCLPIC